MRDKTGKAVRIIGAMLDLTDRKQAEESIRREQSLLDSVMRTTDVMLVLLDPQFNFVWVNPAYATTCQMKPEEMVGKNHFALYPDAENETIFRKVRDTGEGVFYKDKPFVFPDQPERGVTYWDWSLTPTTDAHGEVTGLIFSLRETTRFKQAEEALRQSEERLRVATESARTGMWSLHIPSGQWEFSPQALKVFGLPDDKPATLEQIRQRTHHDDRSRLAQENLTALSEPGLHELEYRIVRPDGEIRWVLLRGQTHADADGRPWRNLGVAMDITERKQAEEALRESEATVRRQLAELQAIYDNAPIGLSVMDTELRWVRINRRLAEMNGFPPEEHLGRSVRDLLPILADQAEAMLRPILQTGQPVRDLEFVGETPAQPGVQRTWKESFLPLRDGDGKVIGLNVVCEETTERKRAEEALRESEARFRVLTQNLVSAVALINERGEISLVNQSFLRMFELTEDADLLNIGSGDWGQWKVFDETGRLFDPEEHPVRKAARTGTAVRDVLVAMQCPGCTNRKWVLISTEPILDSQGNLHWLICTYHDITERKRAEEAIASSEREFRLLAESMPQIVWTTRADGLNTYFNRRWVDYTGLTLKESYGTGWNKPFHPDDRKRAWAAWHNAVHHDAPYLLQCRLRRADGVYRWWLIHGVPVRDEKGSIVKWFGTCTDIDDMKRADEAVRESERLYRAIGESIDYGVWVCDPEGRNTYASDSFLKLVGMTQQQCSDFGWGDVLHPDDAHRTIEAWKECVRTGGTWDMEHRFRGVDRQWHSLLARGVPVRNALGQVTCWVGINLDISKLKQAQEELHDAKEAAEAANVAKSQFLANMSHELRTPMNAILGMIDVALPKATDPVLQDCLKTARGSADLLLTLLNDLLDSAKIESGKLELESTAFGLRRMLDHLTQVLSVRATEKGVAFSCRIPQDTPDAVVGDRTRLQQVLLNLAGNAIKFTERGEVEVSLRAVSQDGEAHLEFAVRDTGIGIPTAKLDHIFKPFAQADASTTRRFGGTGLGLSICRQLVERMGGTIWSESKVGVGSTFHFTVRLPLATELPPELDASVTVAETAVAQLRILLVEDNPANQKLATYILEDRGHVVDIAGNGQDAVYWTERNRYDVILMDVQMPGMNGLEATAAIRQREAGLPHVPIIAMTAHAMKGDREMCLEAGMDGYLSKPINAREMIGAIESLAQEMNPSVTTPAAATPSAPGVSGSAAVVFNQREALSRCCDDPEVLQEMAECFFAEVKSLFPQMRVALKNGDLVEVGRLGHRMKGTVVYLGAEPAKQAALSVERFCKTTGGTAAEAEVAVNVLERECETLKAALSRGSATSPATKSPHRNTVVLTPENPHPQ